ncbi:MAG: ribonuclease J [Pyrinomonadaceae bacterium]
MNNLEIMPLGGVGEFGMNCMMLRFGEDVIIIDAGMGFPEEADFGVDICIPNFEILEEYRENIRALILTHAHEDHIGATAFFLKKFNVPVYASRLTIAFIEEKLLEFERFECTLIEVEPCEIVREGNFEIEFIHASHSLVECYSVAVKTPVGTVFHTGDYKIDDSPVIGEPYDLQSLKRLGKEGILAVFGDSTNATVQGRTPSEQEVIPDLRKIFDETEGRLFVTTFSSSFHRIQILLDLTYETGRKICALGRSLRKNVDLGIELGLLDAPPGVLLDLNDIRRLPHEQVVYLATGSQGEMRSAMWGIATQSYKGIQIYKGDTVVISSRTIPGNEKRIAKMISAVYRAGGTVIEDRSRQIHVSGHGAREDIRILLEALKPRFLVPIHGEFRMLCSHKEFAVDELGFSDENVFLIEDGDILTFDQTSARKTGKKEVSRVLISNDGMRELEEEALRVRKKIASTGLVLVNIKISEHSRILLEEPKIRCFGLNPSQTTEEFLEQTKGKLVDKFQSLEPADFRIIANVEETIRIFLKRAFSRTIGAKPYIIVEISEK